MKQIIVVSAICILFLNNTASAAGFHYCTGKVIDIVTRATTENTSIRIDNMNGWATMGYGGNTQTVIDMQKRQFAMLLSANLTGRVVQLEFENTPNISTCDVDHAGMLIRYVRFF